MKVSLVFSLRKNSAESLFCKAVKSQPLLNPSSAASNVFSASGFWSWFHQFSSVLQPYWVSSLERTSFALRRNRRTVWNFETKQRYQLWLRLDRWHT